MGKRLKIFAIATLTVLAALAALPWVVPASAWLPQLETEGSKRLGVPLKITALTWSVYPLPHARVEGLDLGKGMLTAQSIGVYPQLTTLLSERRVIRLVRLNGVSVAPQGLDWLIAQAAKPRDTNDTATLTIEQIRATSVRISTAAGALPALNAEIDLNPQAALPVQRALVTTVDGRATFSLTPGAGVWQVALDAANWQLPVGPALVFSSLNAKGQANAKGLLLPEVRATLYGGRVNGNLELTWGKVWKLAGAAKLDGIDILPVAQALKLKSALSGKLDASGPFSAQAAKPAGLAEAFNADLAFEVRNGVLHGFDLAAAAKNLLTRSGGGNTQFDQLTGRLKVSGRSYKFSTVRITSGVLKAEGNVDISAANQLRGRIDTELKGTAGLVGVPLAVSGTLDSPVLLPTKGSMVGAAVGTVLLPGVGTSIGSSVGDKLGKLFGK